MAHGNGGISWMNQNPFREERKSNLESIKAALSRKLLRTMGQGTIVEEVVVITDPSTGRIIKKTIKIPSNSNSNLERIKKARSIKNPFARGFNADGFIIDELRYKPQDGDY